MKNNVDTACAPTPQNPTRFVTFPGKILAKSQKHKKFKKIIKSVRLLDFFDFFDFSTFRAEIPWNVNFSTFRVSAGENRDFHGVTATSQKSTQRKLTHTQIEPSRPTHQPLPPTSSHFLPDGACTSSGTSAAARAISSSFHKLRPGTSHRTCGWRMMLVVQKCAPQWTIPNLGWFFTMMFYSIFLTKNKEVINQVIFIHPKFSKSNLPNI